MQQSVSQTFLPLQHDERTRTAGKRVLPVRGYGTSVEQIKKRSSRVFYCRYLNHI